MMEAYLSGLRHCQDAVLEDLGAAIDYAAERGGPLATAVRESLRKGMGEFEQLYDEDPGEHAEGLRDGYATYKARIFQVLDSDLSPDELMSDIRKVVDAGIEGLD